MPVEIRELVIRATVEAEPSAASTPPADPEKERAEMVALCVEQVLEILRRKKER